MAEVMPPIAELLPHEAPMCLLDRLVEVDGERLVAEVDVPAEGMFSREGSVGGWVGIEYLAQAVAAWAGWRDRVAGRSPRIGFLLGTRSYRSVPRFAVGQRLRVEIECTFQSDNGLGQFDGRISADGVELASAQVTVFGPENPEAFLNGETA